MANWLDKYEQGGLVLKKKTKDNYDLKANPNDVQVSVGPGFVGMGNDTTGRHYSPAWGGQFQNGGGLWNTDKKAFVDSTLNANKHLDFVKRLYDQSLGSIQIPGEHGKSTHFMANDNTRVYPEVVNINGKLQYLPGDKGWNYADSTGEYINFKTPEQAEWFAISPNHSTGYKMGTGVLTDKKLPKKQLGGPISPVDIAVTAAKIANWFKGDDKKAPVKKPVVQPEDNSINIIDKRKKLATTGQPLRPNVDLLNGDFNTGLLGEALTYAKSKGATKDDLMNLAAMSFQETKWGNRPRGGAAIDENIGHVNGNWEGENPREEFVNAYMAKMKEADRLHITDPALRLQVYNGLGTIRPSTESKYHGFNMQKIYGVPVPKQGINMRKNPLYGKQVLDVRDNVLSNSPEFMHYIDSTAAAPIQKMQMGGAMPGAVGFTYARTAGSAPSNGKYAKKTKASAQFGVELMPYIAPAAVKVSEKVDKVKDAAINKVKDVIKNSPKVRSTINDAISYVANTDFGKQQLKNFANNIDPYSYAKFNGGESAIPVFDRIYSTTIKNQKEPERKLLDEKFAKGEASTQDSIRMDLLNRYAGLPEKYGTLKESQYAPTMGDKNKKYFSSPQIERLIKENFPRQSFKSKEELEKFVAKHLANQTEDPQHPFDPSKNIPVKGKGHNYLSQIEGLGSATYGIGEDEKGYYLSYYDNWDLNPYAGISGYETTGGDLIGSAILGNEKENIATKHIGNPTDVYGRIYFDKKTGKPKMQNGGEMEYYQNSLDWKPKNISKNGSVIKDDMGQWAHPGEITEINSNQITMQGVDYPVLGVSDSGDVKLMQPGENYKFKGKKVTEYPTGAWLDKYK